MHKGDRTKVNYITIVSDGTEETDLVVYDSSALNATDPSDCAILGLEGFISILDQTAVDIRVNLEFDADTDVLAISLPTRVPFKFDFNSIGGLTNYAGTGKTGDITITTTGLEAGDTITLILTVKPN